MSIAFVRPVRRATTVIRDVVSLYRDRDIPFLAGSVAYAAFVSLLPLVLLLLIVAAALGGDAFRQYVLASIQQYLTPSAQSVVAQSLSGAAGQLGFSIFGIVALVWSALKVFRTLDTAFTELYGQAQEESILDQVRDGLVVVGAMAVAAVTMVAVGTVFALASSFSLASDATLLVRVLSVVALVVGLTGAFLPMYYVFPDVDVSFRDAVPGALVAAVGWTLLQGIFQLYVSLTGGASVYGAIGGIILVLTWLYFGAIVVLVGTATNVARSEGVPNDRSETAAVTTAGRQ